MEDQLSGVRIAGVALLLFSAVLLGVGIHHLVATGTCSSTGYSANYGPVPHCPSGTGWWFAFVFAGIIGGVAGALMAGSIGLVFAGIFGAIGFGALTILFDAGTRSSTKVFAAAFGGCFALVGIVAWIAVLTGAVRSLRSLRPAEVHHGKTKTTSRGSPTTSFSPSGASMGVPSPGSVVSTPAAATTSPTALNLLPGLQAVRNAAMDNTVDELSKLAALHERGGLTDQEFADAKAKLLSQM